MGSEANSGRARTRAPALGHHLAEAAKWLFESQSGSDAVALSYAAFELRLAIERLALHYWLGLSEVPPSLEDLQRFSFKRARQAIYDLAGHQKAINAQHDFMRVVLKALKIQHVLATPDLGTLARQWHDTSELCHVLWTFASSDASQRAQAFSELEGIRASLELQLTGLTAFPRIDDPTFLGLRNDFVEGKATADDVRSFLAKNGAWAVKRQQGKSEFIGEPIPPQD